MDYRVPPTDPPPPARGVAWIGGLSALALAVSPFLVWWAYEWIPLMANLDGTPQPTLTARFPGRSHAFGQLLIFFGLVCIPLWVMYGRDPRRWMRPVVAQLVISAYLVCAVAACTLIAYIVLTGGGLPGMYADSQGGPGLYLALGSSLAQSGCLLWLLHERVAWARMQKQPW